MNFPGLGKQTQTPKKSSKESKTTQSEFDAKWKTLTPGQKLVGPDGVTYTKK